MRARVAKAALAPNQVYVCLSCRLQGVEVRSQRRYQHAGLPAKNETNSQPTGLPGNEEKKEEKGSGPSSPLRIRDIIRGFMFNNASKEAKEHNVVHPDTSSSKVDPEQRERPTEPEHSPDDPEAKQKVLQQKFAVQRRKQMLKLHAKETPAVAEDGDTVSGPTEAYDIAKAQYAKAGKRERRQIRATRRLQAKGQRTAAQFNFKLARKEQSELDSTGQDSLLGRDHLVPLRSDETSKDTVGFGSDAIVNQTVTDSRDEVNSPNGLDSPVRRAAEPRPVSTATSPEETPQSKPTEPEQEANKSIDTPKQKKNADLLPIEGSDNKSLSEKDRKEKLVKKLAPLVRKHSIKGKVGTPKSSRKSDKSGKTPKSSAKISDVTGFASLQGALGRKAGKTQTVIERADATKLKILPIKVEQPPVPGLAYGLERVLFNPGVYQLQDPRSRVYNFDPYLQKIMPVAEFDFSALKEYITSSKDESLKRIARQHRKRYIGSTSSMTGALAHFHFLLSQWRPINASMMSKNFPAHLTSFTVLQRTPSAIFLRWKDGSYAIDADKQFADANILSMLGKSMEKLLTLDINDYERYRKSSPDEVSEEEQLAPESFHYSTMGDFLMRSQLDAHDPRLPGTGMFDLKTRAVVSIRMDVTNYEHGLGYQIKSRQGEWESYEREYYDMIRAAFLKYSMQVRMGRMDGIFVAFHNIERIFGFQYISLPEMDSTIHGQWDTSLGDQEFKLSLDLLNKILDKATKKFPETSLRIHFETRDAATPFMYIFAEPVTEEEVAEIQGQNDVKIQEFERNILGLNRAKESEDQDSQEDDGKWDNIQASVQEAMDKDELSVDEPSQNVEAYHENPEEDEPPTKQQRVIEEGPLYANRNRAMANRNANNTTIGGDTNEVSEDENDSAESGEVSDEEDEEPTEIDEPYEKGDKESDDNVDFEGGDESASDVQEAPGQALEEDSAILEDPTDKDLEPCKSTSESINPSNVSQTLDNHSPDDGTGVPETEGAKDIPSPSSNEGRSKLAEKAAYTPPVPGEEPPKTDYQTEADSPFLDSMAQETAQTQSSDSAPSELLAMTLTLRNKVNNQFVHRPENLTAKDVWSIEYSLLEVPTQQKAKALYEACKLRRSKKLDTPEVPEDAEVINKYLANLRKMSTKGRNWRQEMDEKDGKKPVQVLGRAISTMEGESDLVDQDPDA